jgi:LysM repeat protein
MVKNKYQKVLDLGEHLQIKNGEVKEENGKLYIKGTAENQYQKDLLWNEIKSIGGESPIDLVADITVTDDSIYAKHIVKSGDSLSKIAKQYYGNPSKYNTIFQANTDQLKNPDLIHPGQILKIPNL